jgi:hypothetical protein
MAHSKGCRCFHCLRAKRLQENKKLSEQERKMKGLIDKARMKVDHRKRERARLARMAERDRLEDEGRIFVKGSLQSWINDE